MSVTHCYKCGENRAKKCVDDFLCTINDFIPLCANRSDIVTVPKHSYDHYVYRVGQFMATDKNFANITDKLNFSHPGVSYDPKHNWFSIKVYSDLPLTGKRKYTESSDNEAIIFTLAGCSIAKKFLPVIDELRHYVCEILDEQINVMFLAAITVIQSKIRRIHVKKEHHKEIGLYLAAKTITAFTRRKVCDGLIVAFNLNMDYIPIPNIWQRMLQTCLV